MYIHAKLMRNDSNKFLHDVYRDIIVQLISNLGHLGSRSSKSESDTSSAPFCKLWSFSSSRVHNMSVRVCKKHVVNNFLQCDL